MSKRTVLFSDAVFAITATVKVLPIKMDFPVASLRSELHDNAFPIIMYFASFFVVSNIWRNHVLLFDRLKTHDENIIWLNLLLLLLTSFTPYPLTLLGDFIKDKDAMLFCVITFMAIALVQSLMIYYTNRRSSLLSDVFKDRQFSQATKARYTLWHDIAIGTRISMIWVIFLIAYVFTFVDYRAALGVLFSLALCAPLYGYAERRLLGLNLPVTQFLEHEVRDRMCSMDFYAFAEEYQHASLFTSLFIRLSVLFYEVLTSLPTARV
eukprot:m.252967 g.252967  ORF g.252967 m.252967 type:complete len:266 (+) comp19573_c0_seq3:325-1122(+)